MPDPGRDSDAPAATMLADELTAAAAAGPVLDVGCGPARHALALARSGVEAVGIDVAPAAARLGRRRGATVVRGSVFDVHASAGRWQTALLLDGNVGIGGDPVALLRRVRRLLRPDGRRLVETEGPGIGMVNDEARLEAGGRASGRFRWGRVGVDGLGPLAARSGFHVGPVWSASGRTFARLDVDPLPARP